MSGPANLAATFASWSGGGGGELPHVPDIRGTLNAYPHLPFFVHAPPPIFAYTHPFPSFDAHKFALMRATTDSPPILHPPPVLHPPPIRYPPLACVPGGCPSTATCLGRQAPCPSRCRPRPRPRPRGLDLHYHHDKGPHSQSHQGHPASRPSHGRRRPRYRPQPRPLRHRPVQHGPLRGSGPHIDQHGRPRPVPSSPYRPHRRAVVSGGGLAARGWRCLRRWGRGQRRGRRLRPQRCQRGR